MAAHRGLNPETALMAQLTSHGQSASSRRPHSLKPTDMAALKREDRHYIDLTSQLIGFPRKSAKYREIHNRRRAHLERICKIRLKQIRDKWSDEQGVEDIARHVRGEQVYPRQPLAVGVPGGGCSRERWTCSRHHLQNQYITELQRRTTAIQGLIDYCGDDDPVVPKAVRAPLSTEPIANSGPTVKERC
ncbi:hypothetical protein F5883DRAFT_581486 [Diaporthe sp. PMI_573]|nr:hypothetical protein F5883DRAFT_581486 [Diaporthaceae sp. PMI_573]